MSRPLKVAISSEEPAYDGEVLAKLLQLLLKKEIHPWRPPNAAGRTGDRHVISTASIFLKTARANQLEHAVFAIDNDGRANSRLPHDASSDQRPCHDGCRYCELATAIPEWWQKHGHRLAVVVPVQTLETWFLALSGHPFKGAPEEEFDRRMLKRLLFSDLNLPVKERCQRVLAELDKPRALDVLEQRPSFKHFAEQVRAWI